MKPTPRPEPGEPVYEDNGHRFTWVHDVRRSDMRGPVAVARCACVDCGLVRRHPVRRDREPRCRPR
jgi:hypothetical protein